MKRFEAALVAVNVWAVVVLLAAMACLIFVNVALRYLSNHSIIWAEEVARYMMVWMAFLGSGLVLRVGGHVAITNLHDALPGRAQRWLRGLVMLLLLAFFVNFAWAGLQYAQRMSFQLTPATRISFGWIYAAIPIGFLLMAVHLLFILRAFVTRNATGSLARYGVSSDLSPD